MQPLVVETDWLGKRILTFRDLIPRTPRALFVGLNPSPVSLAAGHYHQGRLGKRMWRRMEQSAVIPSPPAGTYHDEWLFRLGFGLTDLVKRPSPTARDLTSRDFAHGRARLLALLQGAHPPLICFVYKLAAEQALGKRIPPGAGLVSARIESAQVFLMPGPYTTSAEAARTLRALKALLRRRSRAR